MSHRRLLVIGVLSNYGAFVTTGIVNFILVGFLVREIGPDAFGIITLVISFTIVAELLGRGMVKATTKYLASFSRDADAATINQFVSTSFAWLAGCAVLGSITFFILGEHVSMFEMPDRFLADARLAFWLMGARVLLCFPFNAFQGVLLARQRYDVVNVAKVISLVTRLVVVITWFKLVSAGIPQLVIITIATLILERWIWYFCARREVPDMRLGAAYLSRSALKVLVGFGALLLVIDVANMIGYEAAKWVMGKLVSVRDVGAYALIAQLAQFAASLVLSISSVLVPAASRLDSARQHGKNVRLVEISTKYAMIIAGGLCIASLPLLDSLLTLWVGESYSADYLAELTLAGRILLVGQWATATASCLLQSLSGVGRVRVPAIITLAWAISGLGLLWACLHWVTTSLVGAVICLASARTIGSIAQVCYGSRVLQLTPRRFIGGSIVRPALCAAAALGIALLLNYVMPARRLDVFIFETAIIAVSYGLLCWGIAFSQEERRELLASARRSKLPPESGVERRNKRERTEQVRL